MRIVTLDASARENILSSLLKRDPNNYESYTRRFRRLWTG